MVLIYDDSEISINKKKKNEFVMLIKNWDGDYNKFWDNFPVSLMPREDAFLQSEQAPFISPIFSFEIPRLAYEITSSDEPILIAVL